MYKGHKWYYIFLIAHAQEVIGKITLERINLINMALYTAETSLLRLLNHHKPY